MHFDLVDRVLENSPEGITTLKHVSAAEEYLQDHFPGFPVLPGVMMLEAMVQAGRRHLERFGPPGLVGAVGRRAVLGRVRALKYGRFVKPGASIRVQLTRLKHDDSGVEFKGEVALIEPTASTGSEPATACSGRILLRTMRVCAE